jgi:hypothetical protein
MMAIENDFLPFAAASGANVVTQGAYAAMAALQDGFTNGLADAPSANKVWRQASIMTAVIAGFIVAESGQPSIDDGTTATLQANLLAAIIAVVQSQFASPAFTGVPTAPTAAPNTNSTQIATTAFVDTAISNVNAGTGYATEAWVIGQGYATEAWALAKGWAPIDSPTFTGNPEAPTPAAGAKDQSIATTAFVTNAIAAALANYLPKNNPTFTGTMTGPAYNT